MAKKVLIIRSNPIAPDPRVDKIANSLANSRYKVNILSWARNPGYQPIENVKNYTIHRLEFKARYGSGLNNLPALLVWQLRELIWLCKHRHDFDYMHACDFDTIIPALIAKILFKKILIYDIFDFYADHLRKTPKIIKTIIKWIDLKIIGFVDAVILVDENRLSQIAGSTPKQIEYIYNSPIDTIPHANNSPLTNSLKIVYVGLLQKERGLIQLLELMEKHEEWHLELAGFGGDEIQIAEISNTLPNVNFHGRVDYEKSLSLGNACDVFYALYDPEIQNHKYASPNKIFEAMMLRKPVIVAKNTNIDSLIEKLGCGLVVDYSDTKSIEAGLKTLENTELRNKLGAAGREAYEQNYSWNRMEQNLLHLYQQLNNQ